MLIDAAELDPGTVVEADVCIVGAGAAGISLALELRASGLSVSLLEGGGLEVEAASQELYRASQQGIATDPLDGNRLRVFGGTTGHWGGWCFPLDASDFEARPWVPHSGWPFPRSELDGDYAAAHRILDIDDVDYDYRRWLRDEERRAGLGLETEVLRNFVIHRSWPPIRMGTAYREALGDDPDVTVVTHANVVELEADETASAVTGVRASTLGHRELRARARRYVLAAGTVENARLLLASSSVQPEGLGNGRDLVGRFFMQHPQVTQARWASEEHAGARLQRETAWEHALVATAITPEAARENRMLNYHFLVFRGYASHDGGGLGPAREAWARVRRVYGRHSFERAVAAFVAEVDAGAAGGGAPALAKLAERPEQAPNPESRIRLGGERDALGMRRVVMDWRLGELDRHTLARGRELVALELGRLGLGRVRDWPEGYDPTEPGGPFLHGGNHHFGTTRMHDDPARGVVDRHARVHGIRNLYVAGGSVFPTTGFANPTLTIVALALRLARELRRSLAVD